MNNTTLPRWIWLALLASAALALVSIGFRYRVETRNKASTIALEIEPVESVAPAQGMSTEAALARLKVEGLGAVVLSEETVGDLLTDHEFSVLPGPTLVGPESVLEKVRHAIQRRVRGFTVPVANGKLDLSAPGSPSISNLRAMSVGLNDQEVAACRSAGLRIIGRFGNPVGATPEYVRSILHDAKEQGVEIFLPVGDQVLGRRSDRLAFEETLSENGLFYASPEFAKIGGDENIVRDIPDRVIRLHSAQTAELDKLPPAEAVDRYARAARERNERILLLRPYDLSSDQPVASLGSFVRDVDKAVRSQGGEIGAAKPFEDPKVPRILFALLGLALAPAIWACAAMFVTKRSLRIAGGILIGLAGLGCYAHALRGPMAFLTAVAFPILAFQLLEARKIRFPILEYLLVSGVSLVGGLGVAGLMNGLPYYIRAEEFQGVKAAVFLPILVVSLMLYARLANLRSALKDPVTWGQAALSLVLLGALLFMLSRTGNDNPAGVSSLELRFRDLLDALLFVRPRTKEFMVGHPALFVGICMLMKLRSGWRAPRSFAGWTVMVLGIGAMGQTDVVNTMCHFHTPVALSLARIGIGLAVGAVLGFVAWALLQPCLVEGKLNEGGDEGGPARLHSEVAN